MDQTTLRINFAEPMTEMNNWPLFRAAPIASYTCPSEATLGPSAESGLPELPRQLRMVVPERSERSAQQRHVL